MRLTRKVFSDLAIFMGIFGFMIGTVFPFFVTLLGVPSDYVLTLPFFIACISAGLIAGGVNYYLARKVVGSRLIILSNVGRHMRSLAETMRRGIHQADEEELTVMLSTEELCGKMGCQIEVDSDDEFGESATAFNLLAQTLSRTIITERAAHSFSNMLATQLDIEPLADKAIRKLMLYTNSVGGLLAVVEHGELETVACHVISDVHSVLRSDYVKEAINSGETQIIRLPKNAEIVLNHVIGEHNTKYVIVDPIVYKGVSLGVIVLAAEKDYDEEVIHRISILRIGLGLALNNSLTHGRMRLLATQDPLTGVYNRGFGAKRLNEEFQRAVRGDSPLGVILFDIDDFKVINDTYGHLIGDRVLIGVVKSVRSVLREGDILTRYGGEEFLVVLPGASSVDVAQMGERIRHAVKDMQLVEGSQSIHVTISLGGVSHPELNVSQEDVLIRHADEALYRAKGAGKDRIEMDKSGFKPLLNSVN
ncbi:GGDEF domain-containing protein [Shewanella avicenniae]|uniref:diguanylate cyclase n=1 Tax=Shewanella avicenniae TaxID=2814294 RepID=A0ABX7QLE5_9GAMM|nr:GGDEF domain-containing protein [Shewanella avicenniae]QSX32279.1 GGDEF domain-containing protein [Shewanella avicenniae]